MKTQFLLSVIMLSSLVACNTSEIKLIQNKHTDFEIIHQANADSLELKAANELQKYLGKISGITIPISTEAETLADKRIYIGNTNASKSLGVEMNEIVIKTHEGDLFILGGNSRSTLYAVYTFLEDFLGCRFYTPEMELIPESASILIPKNTLLRYAPPITTRTVHSRLYYNHHDFADKRKTTYEAFPRYVPSAGVHTFHRFVPSEKYLQSNPEYYALRNGRRIPTQLCLTNEQVLEVVIEKVGSLLEEHPKADVISVSQDDNQQYCQCDNCEAINDREGTPAGSVIDFVNKVAEQFPDKMISTLAYQYTRTAPNHIKPRENVLITLCSIECDRSAPINEKCSDFADDLIAWGKLTDNIRIWDYTTQFTNFLAPFPNIYTLQPNIHLFRDNNAKWVFEQHSHHPSELFELRSYLTAKLLWNPDINQDSVITDFLDGYYEEAAPFIQNYISTIHEEIRHDADFFLFLYGDPSQGFNSFLRPELLKQYDRWFDEAKKAIIGKTEVLKRLNRARLSIDYAILEAARINDPESFNLVTVRNDGKKDISDEIKKRLSRFRGTCSEADITLMNEMRFTVEEYLSMFEHTISRAKQDNIAKGKEVQLLQAPRKYANEDPQVLTDGALGGSNFYANWLGFEGNDLEAVIDFASENEISFLSCDFLQVTNHVVFFPTEVKFFSSSDGKSFNFLGKVDNKHPLSRQSKINDVQSFDLSFAPTSARYIKVVANNMNIAPDWHHAAGLPSWIFVDELIAR